MSRGYSRWKESQKGAQPAGERACKKLDRTSTRRGCRGVKGEEAGARGQRAHGALLRGMVFVRHMTMKSNTALVMSVKFTPRAGICRKRC